MFLASSTSQTETHWPLCWTVKILEKHAGAKLPQLLFMEPASPHGIRGWIIPSAGGIPIKQVAFPVTLILPGLLAARSMVRKFTWTSVLNNCGRQRSAIHLGGDILFLALDFLSGTANCLYFSLNLIGRLYADQIVKQGIPHQIKPPQRKWGWARKFYEGGTKFWNLSGVLSIKRVFSFLYVLRKRLTIFLLSKAIILSWKS